MADNYNHIDSLNRAYSIIGLGRQRLWQKWGQDVFPQVLDHGTLTVLQKHTGDVASAMLDNNKTELLLKLTGLAAYTTAWIEAMIKELMDKGYSLIEIQNLISEAFAGPKVDRKISLIKRDTPITGEKTKKLYEESLKEVPIMEEISEEIPPSQ